MHIKIKSCLDTLKKLYPGKFVAISCDFRSYGNGKFETEWSIDTETGLTEFFTSFEQLEARVYSLIPSEETIEQTEKLLLG